MKKVFAILLFALLLRLPHLNGSFWMDEAAQVLESNRPFFQQLQITGDFQPPLIHILIHGLLAFSAQEWWLRTGAALVPGLVTIAGVLWIGKTIKQERTAQLAAVFLATSSFHIFFSQELRPYSLPAMFATLGWGVALKLIQKQSDKQKLQLLLAWLICSSFGLYSSYLYPFALLGQVVFLGWSWRRSRLNLGWLAVTTSGIGISFFPWLSSFIDQVRAGQQLRTQLPGWENVVSLDQFRSIALTAGKFLFGVLDLSAHPFFVMTTLLIGAASAVLVTNVWRQRNLKGSTFSSWLSILVCWVAIPLFTAWLVSWWIPVIQPKRVLFALPAMYLGLAWLIGESIDGISIDVFHKVTRTAALTLTCLLLGINIYSTTSYYRVPQYQREDWRGMHDYITEKYNPTESVVVFGFTGPFASWEWYNLKEQYPTFSTGVFVVSQDQAAPDRFALKGLTHYRYILVFDYLRDLTDPDRLIEQDLERYGYTEVDRITPSTSLGIVHVYAQTRQIIGSKTY